jgi:hypothetical protein
MKNKMNHKLKPAVAVGSGVLLGSIILKPFVEPA